MATFYGHTGKSTDNAFNDNRRFMHFPSKKAFKEMQDKIWNESNREKNLIPCSAKFVNDEMGKQKHLADDGFVYRSESNYIDKLMWEDQQY